MRDDAFSDENIIERSLTEKDPALLGFLCFGATTEVMCIHDLAVLHVRAFAISDLVPNELVEPSNAEHQVIEGRSRRNDPLVNGLFIPPKELRAAVAAATVAAPNPAPSVSSTAPTPSPGAASVDVYDGTIQNIKSGFGFIRPAAGGANVFFFYAEVTNLDFSELQEGDKVRYKHGRNDRGVCAVDIEVLRETPAAG